MNCKFCNTPLPEGARFCLACGREQISGLKASGSSSKWKIYIFTLLGGGIVLTLFIGELSNRLPSPNAMDGNEPRVEVSRPDVAGDQVARLHCPSGSLATTENTTFGSVEFDQLIETANHTDAHPNDIQLGLGKVLAGKLQSIPAATLVRIIAGNAVRESYGYRAACQVEIIESIDLPNSAEGSKVWVAVGSLNVMPRTTPLYISGTSIIVRKNATLYPDLATLQMHKMGDTSPQALRAYGSIDFVPSPTKYGVVSHVVIGEWIGYEVCAPPCTASINWPKTWWVSSSEVGPSPDSKVY